MLLPRVRPHSEITNRDIRTGRGIGAFHLNGSAFLAVGFRAAPVGYGDVAEADAGAGEGRHGGPVLFDVEGVGVVVADEIVEDDGGKIPGTAGGFDHEHLVGALDVDVAVDDVGDGLESHTVRMWDGVVRG